MNNFLIKITETHFIEVENQVKLTNVLKEFIQNFHKVMNGFKIHQVVIVDINTDAKIKTGISAIYNFEIAKLQW